MLHLDLNKVGDHYEVRTTLIASNFDGPVDAEIVDNKIYVIGTRRPEVWEINLPKGKVTAVEEHREEALPRGYTLEQNYPNPFNSQTVISFEVARASEVELEVFDLAGQQVATLASGMRRAGRLQCAGMGRM